jgi:hypothetical protein
MPYKYSDVRSKKFLIASAELIRETPNIQQRFWSKVKKTDGCWNWIGATKRSGGRGRYGVLYGVDGAGTTTGTIRAHRLSYILNKGNIPHGYVLDHLCHNRLCVNPEHLEPVPSYINTSNERRLPYASGCCLKCTEQIMAIVRDCNKKLGGLSTP